MLAQRKVLTAWALALALPATPAAAQTPPPGWITAPLAALSARPPPTMGPQPDAPALVAGPGEVFEAVPLKYADVSEVAGLLAGAANLRPNDTFTPQEPAFGSAGLQGYTAGGITTPGPPMQLDPQGLSNEPLGRAVSASIGVDRRLNAIVLKGPPGVVAQLKAQIAELDKPLDSVVLETVFVELTETGARNLGIEFANSNGQIATANYAIARGDFPGVANTSAKGGVALNMQAALYAQIDKGQGRIVSKPRIAAQSGSTAKIITGDALPILTSIAVSGVNAVQQQVQYVNVGVTLQIAPRVSADGHVTSHVFAVVSSVTGYSQGYPQISQREASTSATVRDGDSFVIGGLIQEAELTHHIHVPGLGDIPVLGALFSSQHKSRSKTDLYIVITPHIVRGDPSVSRQPGG